MIAADDPRHGTTRGYHAGCRDTCCRRAIARYEKAGRLARLRGGRAIPALGAQRRLRALMRLGWTSEDIARAAGWSHRNQVLRILNGQRGRPTTWLERATHETVCRVFDELSMRLPEMNRYRRRSRTLAERKGWPPPLAWDNIDDERERPKGVGTTRTDRADVLADVDSWGGNATDACRALGIKRDSLQKWAGDNGCSELYRRLAGRETVRPNQYGQEAS